MSPEYKKLAYRRSVLIALSNHVKEVLLPTDLNENPRQEIVCEYLPTADSAVPEDAICDVVDSLEQEAYALGLEMRKFVFVKKGLTEEHVTKKRKRRRHRKKKAAQASSGAEELSEEGSE